MNAREPLVCSRPPRRTGSCEQIHRSTTGPSSRKLPQHKAFAHAPAWWTNSMSENTDLICLSEQKLVGNAGRAWQPLPSRSIKSCPNLDSLCPPVARFVKSACWPSRKSSRRPRRPVLSGILALLWQHGVEKTTASRSSRHDAPVRLYQHLASCRSVRSWARARRSSRPMYVTLETFEVTAREFLRSAPARSFQPSASIFCPGRSRCAGSAPGVRAGARIPSRRVFQI
jgi:hypothetical protein